MESDPNTPRERALLLLKETLIPAWLPKSGFRRLVWLIRIIILLGLLALISSFHEVTLWNWLKLLIVPAVIAGGGFWFNRKGEPF